MSRIWLYKCENCGDVFRDNRVSHRPSDAMTHYCADGSKGHYVGFADDGRELPIEDDATHPDNGGYWRA